MIHTSYFGALSDLSLMMANPVAICGGVPDWYKGPWYRKLAPRWNTYSRYRDEIIGPGDYTKEYISSVLSNLDPHIVVESMKAFYGGQSTLTLLCYEHPGEFCHRHLVAAWLREAGYIIKDN